jgi:hypothetical protein
MPETGLAAGLAASILDATSNLPGGKMFSLFDLTAFSANC